jgi:hypothetical protein
MRRAAGVIAVLFATLVSACGAGSYCAPDCYKQAVIVDAGAPPDACSEFDCNRLVCNAVCPANLSKYGWTCRPDVTGIVCQPICPC